jgi:hypothetical protein
VDAVGNAYVTGGTQSTQFPSTAGAFQRTFGGTSAAFVTKLDSTGTSLAYSTFLGSQSPSAGNAQAADSGAAIVVDAAVTRM